MQKTNLAQQAKWNVDEITEDYIMESNMFDYELICQDPSFGIKNTRTQSTVVNFSTDTTSVTFTRIVSTKATGLLTSARARIKSGLPKVTHMRMIYIRERRMVRACKIGSIVRSSTESGPAISRTATSCGETSSAIAF